MLKASDLPTESNFWDSSSSPNFSYKARLFLLSLYMDYWIEWKWARRDRSGLRYVNKYISLDITFSENDEPMSFEEFSGWIEINLHLQSPSCTILK